MSAAMLSLGFDPSTPPAVRRRVLVVLGAAVLGISSSAVLVRSMEATALAIAAWRTLGAALLLSPALRRGLPRLTARDALGIAVAGTALALHFWGWFASLSFTTVLRSTVLVCLVPVWTGALEWLLHREPPHRSLWLGLVVAVPGVGLMSGGTTGTAGLTGDALAIGAGVLWSVYLLIGRSVRQRVDIATYMCLVCAAAAALLFPVAALSGTRLTGFPPLTWGLLLAAVLGPQLIGHQGFNYAVRYVPASTISALTLLEPVGATVLAAAVLGEMPGAWAVGGGVLVLLGVWVATYRDPNTSGGSGGSQPSPSTST